MLEVEVEIETGGDGMLDAENVIPEKPYLALKTAVPSINECSTANANIYVSYLSEAAGRMENRRSGRTKEWKECSPVR